VFILGFFLWEFRGTGQYVYNYKTVETLHGLSFKGVMSVDICVFVFGEKILQINYSEFESGMCHIFEGEFPP